MKKWIVTMIVFALMLLPALPVFAAGDAVAGKDAYLKKCASCHGQAGEGRETIAKMLKVNLAHLGSKEVQERSDSDLKKIPLEGTGKMKAIKDVNAQMADDIVAFIRTLGKK